MKNVVSRNVLGEHSDIRVQASVFMLTLTEFRVVGLNLEILVLNIEILAQNLEILALNS